MLPSPSLDRRILVVDDEPTNIELLVRIMNWAGFKNVDVARNGAEAIEAARKLNPDIIILDLHMPGVDGYEVLRTLRADTTERAFLPIIVYTADITRETRERALQLGASDFLTKPGEKTEIKLRVMNLLSLREMHCQLVNQNDELEARVQE